ncbi:MAG: polysaccharide pyruvyl transferase family protein [Lachnospiraceae bacterium]|nr:polysaccharide pyruvyl transferase family protein [Lachnospiraceae bacterium]MDE6626695.1 polysaccharide pyruvyl transferase family protein [Lachnospiraceae bacterium]
MSIKVLVTGGNFKNKGAQSMLFVTIDEIRKRIPDCEVYFGCSVGDPKLSDVHFKQICYSREARYIALGRQVVLNFFIAVAKAVAYFLYGKRSNLLNFFDAKRYVSSMDLIVDVSGFALGDKWSRRINESFLNTIRLAKRYNIPIFIMPQSFGPFQYPSGLEDIKDEIAELLQYPQLIFAREKEGYELLTKDFGLTNVVYSSDLVLQNTGVQAENIYLKPPALSLPEISTKHNVGIVPNRQCFVHGDKNTILKRYRAIVEQLLEQHREVYLFRHSFEDLTYCRQIAEMFESEPHVHLLENDFSCFEYDAFVRNFEFIICSRFHGIVHAYKNHVPAIALGWAVKYRELTASVGQAAYIFDIIDENCEEETMLQAIGQMIQNFEKESEVIKSYIQSIQSENCFECISEWVKNNYE